MGKQRHPTVLPKLRSLQRQPRCRQPPQLGEMQDNSSGLPGNGLIWPVWAATPSQYHTSGYNAAWTDSTGKTGHC